MEEPEKSLLENLKNFDKSKLFKKQLYVELIYHDSFRQAFIINEKENQKYDLYLEERNGIADIPIYLLCFYGENDITEEIKMRKSPINIDLIRLEISEIINILNRKLERCYIILNSKKNFFDKDNNSGSNTMPSNIINSQIDNNTLNNRNKILDKNGKLIDITGYFTYQLLEGYILDCLSIINIKLSKSQLDEEIKNLFFYILDIIIYLADIVKFNLNKYKMAYNNRKLLIVDQVYAILISFDSLIYNLTLNLYNYNLYLDLDKKLTEIANSIYQILLASKSKSLIPLQSLIIFIKLIYNKDAKDRIDNYDCKEIYEILNGHMRNLDKNELIYYRKDSSLKEICNNIVVNLFNNNMESLKDEIYYSYLLSCLKCNNLEKKMNALNDISNIIIEFQGNKKINPGFKNFIEKNNILDIFFEDGTHDEVIKRSFALFKYLAKYNCLNENVIEKIIQRQTNNDLMKKILIEIVSELPKEKKDILFNRLCKGIKFDDGNTNNIEFISKLTESCFNSSDIYIPLKDIDNDIDMDGEQKKNETNYYGLNMIFNYIIKDFNDKKNYNENNLEIAINSFERTISKILKYNIFSIDDVFYFLEKLFENIKYNDKHNSIIQSIKLIDKLFDILSKKKYRIYFIQNLKKLDEKYDIITLLINDLTRYMTILPNNYNSENGTGNIYEGIYPHFINIEQRLNLIFFFFKKNIKNYGLNLENKKYIEKIYEIFKLEKYKDERKRFYEIITKNIDDIDNSILIEFYEDILQNKELFDLKEINDNESINLIINIFKEINYNNKAIFYDGRNIRVGEDATIEGNDMLFELLTHNQNKIVQEKVSQLLCDICLRLKNYNSEKVSEYWKQYFSIINSILENIINTNNKIALNGIIKLINKIYHFCCNCQGKMPKKSDSIVPQDSFRYYHFTKNNAKKDHKFRIGNDDKIIDIRWKMGYYYDIHVNNVAFVGINGKIYNLNNDFEIFSEIFSDEKYFYDKGYELVQIKEIPFELLDMKDNPKILIESNDKLYNILINNLKIDLNNSYSEIPFKQKIWNFTSKLPKNYYFENIMKKFGNKEVISENELLDAFNIEEIYLITYSLQCFYYFLFDKNNKNNESINKIEYLNNFIEIHHLDKLIIDKLLNIQIDYNKCLPIQIECLSIIIDVLYELENYKKSKMEIEEKMLNNDNVFPSLLKKLTEIISNLLKINYDIYECIYQDNEDSNEDILSENNDDDDDEESLDGNGKIAKLIENIFIFIDKISSNKIAYLNYIFNSKGLFVKIFINDYINCENEELKKTIDQYLSKNCEKNFEILNNYLEIVLTSDIFNYLVKNDKSGKYFHIISSILKKNFDKKEDNEKTESKEEKENKEQKENKKSEIELKLIEQSKKIIELILDYIEKESELDNKSENENENIREKELKKIAKNKENFKEGLISFLSNILLIFPIELVNYIINKVDICEFFINKCTLRKCVEKPLEEKKPFCLNNQSKGAVYKLLINILRRINKEKDNNLYMKIIQILDNKHKLGFWKTYNMRNWEIESKEIQKGKYVGLKNMTSTCYLNSIIQQLFMIPMFRETIIKIENPFKDNVLYELQLLFSSLKIYEFSYYDPRSFVISNNLNFYEQMDADEFYGKLIDKIENDIKKIFSKNSNNETSTGNQEKENKNETYKYKNIFNYFFGIKVLDELKFVDCGHKRYNEFCYNNIQIEIKDFTNMYESLKNYFKTEVMDGDNKINCEQCNVKRTCHKRLLLKSLPNILVISLKRFEFDYESMLKYKLNKYFEFPLRLDLKDYLIENNYVKNTEYELTGITIHFGVSDFGHYYDLIKGQDNKWYKFNDIHVSEFKEEDIPKEAFGEKNDSEEDSEKEKESGKNNAYILIYTKINKDIENIDETDLALPPYNKYSNIRKDLIDTINLKLYESWIIKNIFSSSYQTFVLGLLKIDISKIINTNIEKEHPQIIRILKNEGYLNNNNDNIDKEKENTIINLNDSSFEIFQFGLRYYFNVILRISRKTQDKSTNNNIDRFKEIINIYIESDINKAKYIIEEFSNKEIIEEFLVYCPNMYSVQNCLEILDNSINILYRKYKNESDENSIINKILNTCITFISKNIKLINLQNVNSLFYKIVNLDSMRFVNYLKSKNLNRWISMFFKKVNAQEIAKNIFNEDNLPTIHSEHSVLNEKSLVSEDNIDYSKTPQINDNDIYDQHFYNKLQDLKSNINLREELKNCINNS